VLLAVLLSVGLELCPGAEADQPDPLSGLKRAYMQTREVWQKSPEEADAAWQFARACFDLADFNESSRARVAEEGVSACRKALQRYTNAATYYYCALNLGQLARTKKLGALKLVEEMEAALKKALELDPKFDYAGPHRTLGLLYTDAPGWPMSIGSRSKAKQHLLKAVALEPDYPENHIALIESYISWGDLKSARKASADATPYMSTARLKFAGDRWKESWRDWDKRWERIRRKMDADLGSPRGKP
jgi:tetratricopeptide (TPR) repeat protein